MNSKQQNKWKQSTKIFEMEHIILSIQLSTLQLILLKALYRGIETLGYLMCTSAMSSRYLTEVYYRMESCCTCAERPFFLESLFFGTTTPNCETLGDNPRFYFFANSHTKDFLASHFQNIGQCYLFADVSVSAFMMGDKLKSEKHQSTM